MNAMSDFRGGRAEQRRPKPPIAPQQIRYWIVIGFLALCALCGGASRSEEMALVVLRPASIVAAAALLLVPGRFDFTALRIPLILLCGFAASIALQIIPLPPALWASLPGHGLYAETLRTARVADTWRPLSLAPDLTWNSLLSLIPAFVALIGVAGIDSDRRQSLAGVLILIACASAMLGVAQLSGDGSKTFYLYGVTHAGSAVGFFANRNHEAALLALCFPMLRMWASASSSGPAQARRRVLLACLFGLFLIPMILVTGSRAGMFLALVALVLTWAMAPFDLRTMGLSARIVRVGIWGLPILGVAVITLFIALGRAEAVQRLLLLEHVSGEGRLAFAPTTFRMIADFFPFGTGQGAFDTVFRAYEPDAALRPTYFNHAHNDLFELAVTGGLPALLLLAGFVAWWLFASRRAFLPYRQPGKTVRAARAGSVSILLLLLASLVDYPLRTAMLTAVLVIAAAWLAGIKSPPIEGGDTR